MIVGAGSDLRPGELRGLTVDRADRGVLQVGRQLVGADGRRPVFGPTKSAASVRRVPIGPTVVAAIKQHLEAFGPGPGSLLFHTRYGSPVSRSTAGDTWRLGAAKMNLPPGVGGTCCATSTRRC